MNNRAFFPVCWYIWVVTCRDCNGSTTWQYVSALVPVLFPRNSTRLWQIFHAHKSRQDACMQTPMWDESFIHLSLPTHGLFSILDAAWGYTHSPPLQRQITEGLTGAIIRHVIHQGAADCCLVHLTLLSKFTMLVGLMLMGDHASAYATEIDK